ncbi:MAG TPA: ATP synthase F1 subunit gamma [Desulfomonilaceae bacterium]|nr:ATP synthase F1 subunit gamma [Desulfomonilaceae bacterium]
MANLRELRKRIASVKNTQKITNAMKMVSAAKLRRAEETIKAARPFADKMRDVLMSLAARTNPRAHPLLAVQPPEKALLILITADRGLCGAFNANLNRRAEAFVRQMSEKGVHVDMINIGRKGHDYFRRRKINIVEAFLNVMNNITYELAGSVVSVAVEKFTAGEYQEVYVLYNSFRSAVRQVLTLRKLLPVTPEEEGWQRRRPYLYEPSEEELLDSILPRYVQLQVFTGLLDSVAAEHGARMTAMEAATSNADEMIYKLTLKLNRLRQESITTELMEIVGGAEALKG